MSATNSYRYETKEKARERKRRWRRLLREKGYIPVAGMVITDWGEDERGNLTRHIYRERTETDEVSAGHCY